jgi:hypothetical protein
MAKAKFGANYKEVEVGEIVHIAREHAAEA